MIIVGVIFWGICGRFEEEIKRPQAYIDKHTWDLKSKIDCTTCELAASTERASGMYWCPGTAGAGGQGGERLLIKLIG